MLAELSPLQHLTLNSESYFPDRTLFTLFFADHTCVTEHKALGRFHPNREVPSSPLPESFQTANSKYLSTISAATPFPVSTEYSQSSTMSLAFLAGLEVVPPHALSHSTYSLSAT
jgi:hypothetical protein